MYIYMSLLDRKLNAHGIQKSRMKERNAIHFIRHAQRYSFLVSVCKNMRGRTCCLRIIIIPMLISDGKFKENTYAWANPSAHPGFVFKVAAEMRRHEVCPLE